MSNIKDNQINLLKEDIACIHQYLDDLNIERKSPNGMVYSIVGRIKRLEVRFQKEKSEIESHYLTNKSV